LLQLQKPSQALTTQNILAVREMRFFLFGAEMLPRVSTKILHKGLGKYLNLIVNPVQEYNMKLKKYAILREAQGGFTYWRLSFHQFKDFYPINGAISSDSVRLL